VANHQSYKRTSYFLTPTKANKRDRQLQAYARKRVRRPEASVTPRGSLKIKYTIERRMIRDHVDVLKNVEFTLVDAANESTEFDDHLVEKVLRHSIERTSSEDPIVTWAMALLAEARDLRADVSDSLWRDALQVIYASLKRQSACEPGDTSYLGFISQFIL
jgi:hypothetical protein